MPMLRTRRATTRNSAKAVEPEVPVVDPVSADTEAQKEDAKVEVESKKEAPASTSTVTLRRKSGAATPKAKAPETKSKAAPKAPEPKVSEPKEPEPKIPEPKEPEPDGLETKEPETKEPEAKEPDPPEEAETKEPETKESKEVEPQAPEPKELDSEASEPKEPEPETAKETEATINTETDSATAAEPNETKPKAEEPEAENKPAIAEVPAETPEEVKPAIISTAKSGPSTQVVEEKQSTSQEKRHSDDLKSILPNSSYLINVALGYGPESNLKQPLKGFTTTDELTLFPVIDSMSSKLFTIVQKMTDCQKKDIETAFKLRKGVVKLSEYPKIFLCHLRFLPSEADKSKSSKRAPHPFLLTEDENIFSDEKLKQLRAVLDAGWKREVVMRSPGSTGRKTGDVYYYSPDGTKYRSSKQVAQHLSVLKDSPFTIDNFSFAKVRISTNPDQEIVRKAYDGKSPPRATSKPSSPVKATPPQPSKSEMSKPRAKASTSKDMHDNDARSVTEEPVKIMSSRRSIHPPKRYSGDAVLLLSKRSKIQDDKRGSNSKGLMQMGMLPPKYPKGMEDSSSNLSEGMDYNDQGSNQDDSSGGNNSMKEIAEDSLFQISALRQSGGIDVDHMQKYVENQKKMAQKNLEKAAAEEAGAGEGATQGGGARPKKQERIPCSIRCPGMTGEIPNLNCSICLCLFHAECLGLPPNLTYNNFICQNCRDLKARQAGFQKKDAEATPTTSSAAASTSARPEVKKIMIMKKPGDLVKRSPPPLIRATSLHQGGGQPRRDIVVTTTSRDSSNRLPQQKVVVPSSVVISRGMGRGRGMSNPPMRSSVTTVHPVHRSSDGSSNLTVISSRGSIMMRRGRGRPPTRGLPQLNNKSLTITHLPRAIQPRTVSGPPPVPNLAPMSSPKVVGKLPLPLALPVKPRQSMPVVPNLMKPSSFKLAVPPPSLSGRTFKKVAVSTSQHHHGHSGMKQSSTVVTKVVQRIHAQDHNDKTVVSLVKRSPQSVCTIGNKKYVVLPKKPNQPATLAVVAVGNGVSAKISYASSGDAIARPEMIQKQQQERASAVVVTEVVKNNGTAAAAAAAVVVAADNGKSSQMQVDEQLGNKTEALHGESSNDGAEGEEPTPMEVDTEEGGVTTIAGLAAASNDSESVVA